MAPKSLTILPLNGEHDDDHCAFRKHADSFSSYQLEQEETRELMRAHSEQIKIMNANFEAAQKSAEKAGQWMAKYVDRTMPIRSHFLILMGSLTILSGFAAIIQYLDRILK